VVEAYAQMIGEGYLEARSGSGTRVAGAMVARPSAEPPSRATAAGEVPGGPAGGVVIDFRPGVPELAAFPRAAWAAALRRAVLGAPTAALG
jgi:GntR family transcriptional regulator/MocR family aminotransferase